MIPNLFDPRTHIGRDEADQHLTAPAATLASNILAQLRKKYPAVRDGWRVWVHESGQMVIVKNLLLAGDMGFILPMSAIDTEYKAVTRAGGELLERYRIARAGAESLIADQLADGERDRFGRRRYDA